MIGGIIVVFRYFVPGDHCQRIQCLELVELGNPFKPALPVSQDRGEFHYRRHRHQRSARSTGREGRLNEPCRFARYSGRQACVLRASVHGPQATLQREGGRESGRGNAYARNYRQTRAIDGPRFRHIAARARRSPMPTRHEAGWSDRRIRTQELDLVNFRA